MDKTPPTNANNSTSSTSSTNEPTQSDETKTESAIPTEYNIENYNTTDHTFGVDPQSYTYPQLLGTFPRFTLPDITVTTLVVIYILIWIRVTGDTQITIVTVDPEHHVEVQFHLSMAMQVRIIRLWFLQFGQAHYGRAKIVLIWLLSVGTLDIDAVPEILSLFMRSNNVPSSNNRMPLHVSFCSRLHRNHNVLWLLGRYFRIVVHSGSHNHNDLMVSRDPNYPIHVVDISNLTEIQFFSFLLNEAYRWQLHYAGQLNGNLLPQSVTDAALAEVGIYSMQIVTNIARITMYMYNDEINEYLNLLPRIQDADSVQSVNPLFDQEAPGANLSTVFGSLTCLCKNGGNGCQYRGETSMITAHEQDCLFNDMTTYPSITDPATATNSALQILILLSLGVYFNNALTLFTLFPVLFINMCTPAGWTYCDDHSAANCFDRITVVDQHAHNTRVPSSIVFEEVLADPHQRAPFILQLSHFLLRSVNGRQQFYHRRDRY